MACSFLGALCVGIEDYDSSRLANLPKARRDVEQFTLELHRRGLRDAAVCRCEGRVSKIELEDSIGRFLGTIERSVNSEKASQLAVIFVAGHGRQLQYGDLPAILTSDATSPVCDVGCVDLNSRLLQPLDSIKTRQLKVWLVIDTCRENRDILTWTGNAQTPLRRTNWSSQTDFHIVLACDKGRLANDEPSLTDALVRAMQDSNKDACCGMRGLVTTSHHGIGGRPCSEHVSQASCCNQCSEGCSCLPMQILKHIILPLLQCRSHRSGFWLVQRPDEILNVSGLVAGAALQSFHS